MIIERPGTYVPGEAKRSSGWAIYKGDDAAALRRWRDEPEGNGSAKPEPTIRLTTNEACVLVVDVLRGPPGEGA